MAFNQSQQFDGLFSISASIGHNQAKNAIFFVGNPSIVKLPDSLKTFQGNLRLGWKIYNTFIVWGILIIDE